MTQPTAGKLSQIRALLDKAESTEFAEEARTYRAKAEELMVKYRIDQEDLLANRKANDPVADQPVPFDIRIAQNGQYAPFYNYMFGDIATHVGVRHVVQWQYNADGTWLVARGVGFELDVQYAELLYTQARLAFQTKLEPTVNPELSDQVNVYNLRSAGIERVKIADIMWENTDKVFLGRVGRLYKAECALRGEEPALSGRGVTGAAYREQYANAFVFKMSDRLRAARGGTGTAMVLGNRERILSEAFYARFPDMRPKAEVEGGSTRASGRCPKCTDKRRCSQHPKARTSNKDYYSAAAVRGRAAGQAAARTVDLGRGTGTGSIGGS